VTTAELLLQVAKNGLYLAVLLAAPMVLAALLASALVGILGAATQIQEPTLGFAPRLACAIAALLLFGPWILSELLNFFRAIFDLIAQVGAG
jgi:flagellar biosynthetic protein FliQ